MRSSAQTSKPRPCNLTLAGLLLFENLADGVLHGVAELAELQEAGADAENQTDTDQQAENDRTPGNVVQFGYKFAESHDGFLLFLPDSRFGNKKHLPENRSGI